MLSNQNLGAEFDQIIVFFIEHNQICNSLSKLTSIKLLELASDTKALFLNSKLYKTYIFYC